MTINKNSNNNNNSVIIIAPTISKVSRSQEAAAAPRPECCMCGDYGVSYELFQCRICQFRSQHRYCSNLYPKSGLYQVCNWCLRQKEDKEKSQNSSNKSNGQEDDINKLIKKQRSSPTEILSSSPPPPTPTPTPTTKTRKRIITNRALEEKKKLLKRTKSELNISNNNNNNNSNTAVIRKPVLRNKVRRYKLLEEVSS